MTPGTYSTPGDQEYQKLTKQDGKVLFGDPDFSQSEQQQIDIQDISAIMNDSPLQISSLVEEQPMPTLT